MKTELLHIAIPLFVFSLVLFSIMSARVKAMKATKGKALLYVIVSGIAFGFFGLVGFIEFYLKFYYVFIIGAVYFLSLGIINQFVAIHILPWYKDLNFLYGLVFNLIIAAFGTLLYLYTYYYISNMGINKFHLFNLVFYFIPFLVTKSANYFIKIPNREYKKWFYPIGKEINDPTEREMESLLVIAFEFQKQFANDEITTFRAKAPKHMQFGKLFYYFIVDYNTKHPESKIEYIYEKSKSYGWIFYIKPTWLGTKMYIDPEITVAENSIEENSVIIVQRVLE